MENKSKVLLIYTGGTIGMIKDPETGVLKSFDFKHLYKHVPEIQRLNIDLNSISFEIPVDSSEMNPTNWRMMAELIVTNYDQYDGFVILHGSDTMAFTASALSFMLQGLKKPIVLTGSQLPIGTIRTDGKENLITAIEIAAAKDKNGNAIVQEVALYFEYSLLRGNRASKISANQFDAFNSPNYPKLAVAGVEIDYHKDYLHRNTIEGLKYFSDFSDKIALIKLFPGIDFSLYSALFKVETTRAVILETYGSGNAPSDHNLKALVTKYIQAGGIVINITQCSSGSVQQGKYETSSFFAKAGVISGRDLTTEAALTKCMHLLALYPENEKVKAAFETNLVGEITI